MTAKARLDATWRAARAELSGAAAVEGIERLWSSARGADFAHMHAAARSLADMMREAGMSDVEIIEYPSDGVAHYGGGVMPRAWDLVTASLRVVAPDTARQALASYAESPLCVMIYSAPTPPEGVTAPIVRVSHADRPESWTGVAADGALVLLDTSAPRAAALAFRHGAVGVITDERGRRDAPPAAYRFLNYTVSPTATAKAKGFGFGLTAARGAQLRAALDAHGDGAVMAHARVESRLYDGAIPVVTGLVPGETDEEVVVTGHLCEPGANDNASGPALAVEVARTLAAMVESGQIPPLRRGVRLCHTYEVRGTNAYVNERGEARRTVAGINLDMVARRQTNHVFRTTPAHPAYTDALLHDVLRRARGEASAAPVADHVFGLVDDNVFGEPLIGAPCVGLVQFQDPTWHTSADTMAGIDAEVLALNGAAAATYCAAIACASGEDVVALARLAARDAAARLHQAATAGVACDAIRHIAEQGGRSVSAALRLANDDATGVAQIREVAGAVRSLGPSAAAFARACGAPPTELPAEVGDAPVGADRYTKAIRGYIGFEHLTDDERDRLDADIGLGWGWGAPDWLQHAAFLCDGSRDVRAVFRFLRHEGLAVDMPVLAKAFAWAAEQGFLRRA